MRLARIMAFIIVWVLTVIVAAGTAWAAIGLAGRQIGVVPDRAPFSRTTTASDAAAPAAGGAGPGPVTQAGQAGQAVPAAAGPPATDPTATEPPATPATGGAPTVSGQLSGPAGWTTRTARETGPGRTTRETGPGTSAGGMAPDSSSGSSSGAGPGSSRPQADDRPPPTRETLRAGSFAGRAGQIRLTCAPTRIADWRVLAALGWSGRARVDGPTEVRVTFTRGSEEASVSARCVAGYPQLDPVDEVGGEPTDLPPGGTAPTEQSLAPRPLADVPTSTPPSPPTATASSPSTGTATTGAEGE